MKEHNATIEKDKSNTLLFQPPVDIKFIEENENNTFLKNNISIYIHIPFCEKKCFFCSIETYQKCTDDDIENYVNALIKEIILYQDYFKINRVNCIHFGGGTPSLLKEEHLERLFKVLSSCIQDFDKVEVVLESNPLSLSNSKINYLSEFGCVSINVGIQTFDDNTLKLLNRGSNFKQIYDCLDYISKKNFRAVGIDLICNLPYSDLSTTISDINIASKMDINHIALYPLRIEPNSIFYNSYAKYEDGFFNNDTPIEVFVSAAEHLKNIGYDQYSIYHFSNQKDVTYIYSRNQMYGGEWIGLGIGAYSSYNGYVFANTNDIEEYIKLCNLGYSCTKYRDKYNTIKSIIWEFIFSFRIRNISKQYYYEKYGKVLYETLFMPIIKYLIDKGYVCEKNCDFQLTGKGMLALAAIENDILDNYEKIILSPNYQRIDILQI